MQAKPLYQPLWADHASLLASRRARLTELLARLDEARLPQASSPVECAQHLLDMGVVAADAIEDQEAIGVAIGDELIRRAGFTWVTVDDDYGSEPVVAHPGKVAVIAPLSAVINRFEDGDVPFDLRAFIVESLVVIEQTEIKERSSERP